MSCQRKRRMEKIFVRETGISIQKNHNRDYISLTDIARYKNPSETALVISHWLSTRFTVDFLGIWETINNPDFNTTEFSSIRNESGSNGFVLTTKQWVEKTNAIGIYSKNLSLNNA